MLKLRVVLKKLYLISELILLPSPSLPGERIPRLRSEVHFPQTNTEDSRTPEISRGSHRGVSRREPHRTPFDGDIRFEASCGLMRFWGGRFFGLCEGVVLFSRVSTRSILKLLS